MQDDNWDLINGSDAHAIEVLNYANQINVIEALAVYLFHHGKGGNNGCDIPLDSNILKEFHRTATLFLLENPGTYREIEVEVRTMDGVVVHKPPSHNEIIRYMSEFQDELANTWNSKTPIEISAFALWKINWIHPFKNGNGRSARAFAYACLCLKYGFFLPGNITIIDLIMKNKKDFQEALKIADVRFNQDGGYDLARLENFLENLLCEQLNSFGS